MPATHVSPNAVYGPSARPRLFGFSDFQQLDPRKLCSFSLLHYLLMQPALHREGYAIFVRCCDLSSETPVSEFVSIIDILDGILSRQIERNEDLFPNPNGGGIYLRDDIDKALDAARELVGGLGASGISAGIGIAWGRFQRTVNVQDWNSAALPLNQAARLAFCKDAVGCVLVTPHVRQTAGARIKFSEERDCEVKSAHYPNHAVESPDYKQSRTLRTKSPGIPATRETNIVLWDIVKYSAKDIDQQADLSHSLALSATTALHKFNAGEDYSPTGDGGFALFDTGLKAIAFAKELGRYAAFNGITVRTGINHGEVAFAKRGPVGPGVLRADAISALAPHNGVAILSDVWRNLDKMSRGDWQPTEIAKEILALQVKPVVPLPASPKQMAFTSKDRNILVNALSNIPQFASSRERRTFIRMALSEHPFAHKANQTFRFLDWDGSPLVVADNLIRLLEAQDVAPGLPALRVIAEAVEPVAGIAYREELVGLRRRLGWTSEPPRISTDEAIPEQQVAGGPGAPGREHLVTLRELFENDWPNLPGYYTISAIEISSQIDQQTIFKVTVAWRLNGDFVARSKFLAFFIESTTPVADARRALEIIADHYSRFIDSANSEVDISGQAPDDTSATHLKDMVFSGRLFVYYENHDFSLEHKGALEALYKTKGLSIQFRDAAYAWSHRNDNQAFRTLKPNTTLLPDARNVEGLRITVTKLGPDEPHKEANPPTLDTARKTLSESDYVNPPKDGSAGPTGWRRLRLDQAEALGIWLGHINELTAIRVLASAKDPEAWEFASEFVRVIKTTPRITLVGGGMTDRQTDGLFGITIMLGQGQEWKNLFSAEVEAAFARSFITVVGRGVDPFIPPTQIDIIVGAARRQL